VRYVTERCVFKLSAAGVELAEVAPGVDVDRDILAHMAFRPLIRDVKAMKPEIFREGRMGLAEGLSDLKLDERVQLDAAGKSLFLDFESMRVRSLSDIAAIRDAVEAALAGMRDRVEVFVNYTRFEIEPEMVAPYAEMVRDLEARRYGHVSRYAAHAFHRMQVERIFGGAG
jgi:propionate CoA-transferase